MTQRSIILELPDELYIRIEQAAQSSERPIETLMLESLEVLFHATPDDINLDDLTASSTPQLWAVVYRRLSWSQSLRLRALSAQAKLVDLSANEQAELDTLLDQVDQAMLLRSQALHLLKLRGENIDLYLAGS